MQSSASRRSFMAGAAAATAGLMGIFGRAFRRTNDAPAERRPVSSPTADISRDPAITIYTFDSDARLIAVSGPCGPRAASVIYADA